MTFDAQPLSLRVIERLRILVATRLMAETLPLDEIY
jgi:hypothetical protein